MVYLNFRNYTVLNRNTIMKKIIAGIFGILVFHSVQSQEYMNTILPVNYEVKDRVDTIILRDKNNNRLNARSIKFNRSIRSVLPYDSSRVIISLFYPRNPDYVKTNLFYNIYANNIEWQNMSYNDYSDIYDNILIIKARERTFAINVKKGNPIWVRDNAVFYPVTALNMGLIYSRDESKHMIEVFNLENGSNLFKEEVEKFGQTTLLQVEDSIIYINNNGLYSINMRNYNSWNIPLSTSNINYGDLFISLGISVAATLISYHLNPEYFCIFYPDYSSLIRTGLTSEIYCTSQDIFISDKDSLYAIDIGDKNVKWKSELVQNKNGFAILERYDSCLIYFNTALVNQHSSSRSFGDAYFSLFDMRTGEHIRSVELKDHKNVVDYRIDSASIIVLGSKSLGIYNLDKLNSVKIKEYTIPYSGNFNFLIPMDDVRIKEGDKYVSLSDIYSPELYMTILCEGGVLLINEEDLNDYEFFNQKRIGIKIYSANDIEVLNTYSENYNIDNMYGLDIVKSDEKIIQLDLKKWQHRFFIEDNKIITWKKKKMTIIDLNKL